jgi:uroporphyrin-3 C-methyltransferase
MTDTDKPDPKTHQASPPTEGQKPGSRKSKAGTKPDTAARTTPPAGKKPARSKKPASAGSGALLARLALICTLIIAAGVFYLWQANRQSHSRLQQQLQQLQQNLEQRLGSQREADQTLQAELAQLRERQKVLSESLDTLLRENRHLQRDWLVNEAEYLVRLANQRLVLARDVDTAIAALKTADARLKETGDPSLIGLRKALAEDIVALQGVPRPDITGLSLRLSALGQAIDTLPLLTPEPEQAATPAPGKTAPQVHSWRELPKVIWEDLKSLVIIREHGGPIKPLLAPEQHFFLIQNLRLQLEQARLALLNGEDGIYHERLATARRWIETWFDPDSDRTRRFLNQLAELDKINIQPTLPTLDRSYQAFQAWRARQTAPGLPPAKPAVEPAAGPAKAPTDTAPSGTNPSKTNPQVTL